MPNSPIGFLFVSVSKEKGFQWRSFATVKGKVQKEEFKTGNKCMCFLVGLKGFVYLDTRLVQKKLPRRHGAASLFRAAAL